MRKKVLLYILFMLLFYGCSQSKNDYRTSAIENDTLIYWNLGVGFENDYIIIKSMGIELFDDTITTNYSMGVASSFSIDTDLFYKSNEILCIINGNVNKILYQHKEDVVYNLFIVDSTLCLSYDSIKHFIN